MINETFNIDFIGVGVPKAGTTWLARCLSTHPEVCFSKTKEINFFNKKKFFYQKFKIRGNKWNYLNGIDWYSSYFSNCKKKQIKGEFSVAYLYDSEALRLIYKHFPNIKILVILRNPIEQIVSNYHHINSQYNISSLEEMIKQKDGFIEYGYYYKYLKNIYKQFPEKNIKILLFDDLKKDSFKFLKSVYNFLNIDNTFVPPFLNKIINPTAPKTAKEVLYFFKLRNYFIKKIGYTVMKNKFLYKFLFFIDKNIREKLIYKTSKRKKSYFNLANNQRQELLKIFKEDISKLEKLINKDLGHWN